MSLSVEELDQTVKAFFEGRGDIVSPATTHPLRPAELQLTSLQQKQAQNTLNQVLYILFTHTLHQGYSRFTAVQRESRCLATGGQDIAGGLVPTNEV